MTETSKDPPSSSAKDVVDETEEKNDTVIESEEETEKFAASPPSMTISLVVYWIIPLVVLGLMSRIGHEPMEVPTFKNTKSRPIVIPKTSPSPSPPSKMQQQQQQQQMYLQQQQQRQQQQRQPSASPHRKPTAKTTVSQAPSKMPSSYREVVDEINGRRRKNVFKQLNSNGKASPQQQNQASQVRPPTATTSADASAAKRTVSPPSPQVPADAAPANPERMAIDEFLSRKREEYSNDPSNVYKMIEYAEAMRNRDLVVHDGGSTQTESIHMYENIVVILRNDRRRAKERGEATDILKGGGQAVSSVIQSVNDEVYLPFNQKSLDGTLVAVLVAKGKQYFMANMFEKAVESYQDALEIAPLYLDALSSKASAQIILGEFKEAAEAYLKVMELDDQENPVFTDAFTGLAKILSAKQDVIEGGWEKVVARIEQIMPSLEKKRKVAPSNKHIAGTLARMHNTLFTYHDTNTKDTAKAWHHLKSGFAHKMAMLGPWNALEEKKKVAMVKNIFKPGFWYDGVGLMEDKTPIFIIGFPRSGSTLLERVLDSHSQVVGTGEDSVFNGRLDQIRNQIVKASVTGSVDMIRSVVDHEAKGVLKETRVRWESIEKTKKKTSTSSFATIDENPQRFTDKMLTNYFNVGFIHMLFPNALILHVARNPMDVLFSSYKHEFPAGTLDYTSEFGPLSDLYLSYREIIEHWDTVLPGRVTHVRYEDMVNDMPGMAKAIIASTGLEWEEGVLDFHKKKHAVNTHSTTQVRKGIYKTAVEAWKRYEEPLQPLVKLVGEKVDWNLKTSLPSYIPPVDVDAK